jgi:SAM-dependent methyltransferase
MELQEYRAMFELEQGHWWFNGLRDIVFDSIQRFFSQERKIRILDAGCGTGFLLKCLNRYGLSFGVDISETALGYCQRRGLTQIANASILNLPFSNDSFDLVISTDVIYHRAVVDERQAFYEIHRVLKKGGISIINLPAHNYLRRAHDDRIHTRQRYSKGELRLKLQNSNFKIMKITYRNTFLLFVLLFIKLSRSKILQNADSDVNPVNNIVNSILYSLLKIENLLLKTINLPLGSSVFCIAKKV